MDKFGSDSAFIITAVGSAVGLGNIFRFPGLAARYGIWFILSYLVLLFAFGLPLLLCELYFGKKQVGVPFCGTKRSFSFGVGLTAINCLAVLSCYLVFFALVMKRAAVSALPEGVPVPDLLFLVLAVALGLISCGSAEKLSRISLIGVVFSVAVMGFLAILGLIKNPDAFSGFFTLSPRVILSPDFFGAVFGQVFFSLSLGVGVMTAFGSMLAPDTPLLKSAVTVCLGDLAVSLISTVIYICLGGREATTAEGITLFSVLLTDFFGKKIGRALGFFFFTAVALLCLNSVVSYIKAVTVSAKNEQKASVTVALLCGGAGLFLISDNFSVLAFTDGKILPLLGLAAGGIQSFAFSFGFAHNRGSPKAAFFRFFLPVIFLLLILRKIFI